MTITSTLKGSVVFCLLMFLINAANGQSDTLTLRQIFNLKTGDTLIYLGYEDISALTEPHYEIRYYKHWGITITGIDTAADSIDFHYAVLDTSVEGDLIVYNPDSTTLCTQIAFSYNTNVPYYKMFDWWGDNGYGVSLVNVTTRDTVSEWSLTSSIDSQFNNRILNQISSAYFEGARGYSLLQGAGLFQAYILGNAYLDPACGGYENDCPGSGTIELIYYHSGSIIWMDTSAFLVSGIREISLDQTRFSLYPNPTTGSFLIQPGASITDESTVQIYNLQLQQVLSQQLTQGNGGQEIEIAQLPAGLYIVNIIDKHGIYIWHGKVIKL